MKNDINKLAHAWVLAQKQELDSVGYNRNSWAIDELIDSAISEPEKAYKTILRILEIDATDVIIKALGAGALEDLMMHHGSQFIDKIEAQATLSEPFKKVMQNVWLDVDDSEFHQRFYKIAGIAPPV
jgi:hypothetical protein